MNQTLIKTYELQESQLTKLVDVETKGMDFLHSLRTYWNCPDTAEILKDVTKSVKHEINKVRIRYAGICVDIEKMGGKAIGTYRG